MNWSEAQKTSLIKLYEEGITYSQIAKRLFIPYGSVKSQIIKLQKKNIIEKRKSKGVINVKTKPSKSDQADVTYKPKKLKIGKKYEFIEVDAKGKRRINKPVIKGKVIEEYPHYYLLQATNFKECINKNSMVGLKSIAI